MRRPITESFNILAFAPEHPEWGTAGLRLHYYRDCRQITGNPHDLVGVEVDRAVRENRELCWSCVARLVEVAELVSRPGRVSIVSADR